MTERDMDWGEPPKAKGGRTSPYEWFYEALKTKPGKWAKYPGTAGGAAGWSNRYEEYEVTTRVTDKTEDDKPVQEAWMRYNPEKAESESSDA